MRERGKEALKVLTGLAGGGCSEDCEVDRVDASQGSAHV